MATRWLPTGTITFLFSDIEGSTRLVAAVGPVVFREVLERHNALLRAAFGAHGGTERGTQGDSFLVMFPDASEAINAAAQAQRAIEGHPWPADAEVHVRMGLHTGVGILGGDDYVGIDVNRAARIAATAHGGQVLVSDTTRSLVRGSLASTGLTLRDLGEHTLRDLPDAERLYQLVIAGLRDSFPPIRTVSVGRADLPEPARPLLGRDRELTELQARLADDRLITLTGPGGTGKTRLALELARRSASDFPEGVHWVALAAVSDAEHVAGAVAERLRVAPAAQRSTVEGVCDVLAGRRMLVVLDNMERLTEAGPLVGELVASSPASRFLVTSRSPLHLSMEQVYPVGPLAVPDHGATTADIPECASVRLFVEGARRVRPGFEPDDDDLTAIAALCRELDGLPLGVEIAAARSALLPPRVIAARLRDRLDLPGDALRDMPERQRTLAATVAWSHDLLDERERALFARLSVFVGGAGLEEAEAVLGGADGDPDVLEGVGGLVDQSLVEARPSADGLRVRMLETIRRFAAARLAETPAERQRLRDRHAATYLALAEAAADVLPGRGQGPLLDRLARDHANLRAATDWAIESGDARTAMRLGAAMWRY